MKSVLESGDSRDHPLSDRSHTEAEGASMVSGKSASGALQPSPLRRGSARQGPRRNSMKSVEALQEFQDALKSTADDARLPPSESTQVAPLSLQTSSISLGRRTSSAVITPIKVGKDASLPTAPLSSLKPPSVVVLGDDSPSLTPSHEHANDKVHRRASAPLQARGSSNTASLAQRCAKSKEAAGITWESLVLPDYLFTKSEESSKLPSIDEDASLVSPAEAKTTAFMSKLRAYCDAVARSPTNKTPSPGKRLNPDRIKVFSSSASDKTASPPALEPTLVSPIAMHRGSVVYRGVREEDRAELYAASDKFKDILEVHESWSDVTSKRTQAETKAKLVRQESATVVTEIQSLTDKISAILARNDVNEKTPPPSPEAKPALPVIDLTSDKPVSPKAPPPPPPRPPPQEEVTLESARPTLETTKSARMYKGVSSLAKKWQKVQRKSVFAAAGRVMEMSSFMAKWEVQRAVTVLRQPGSWFADVTEPDAHYLVSNCRMLQFAKGDYVCVQGDEGSCMYVIIEGELAIVAIQDNRTEKELMRRYHGQIVGEFALISDGVRSASVRAGTDCKLLEMQRSLYETVRDTMADSSLMTILHKLLHIGR